ncbi:hypothetical protein SAMD00023353_0700360 [Rosellinia necatrix]|uniref:Uncharacterized protein n=1 Tax=Rosellinia necatrix TaxID=77044 RepID=A0A1S8A5Z1_ROSNE|nr:hypothetical protein SAMD00023353_0700360 [Rosellinia necatrix]
MASTDSTSNPHSRLTDSALQAHNDRLNRTPRRGSQHDPIPSGTRCLILSQATTDTQTAVERQGAWATSQIEEFDTAFQSRGG